MGFSSRGVAPHARRCSDFDGAVSGGCVGRQRSHFELHRTTLKIADLPVSRRCGRRKSDFSMSPFQEIRHRTRSIHHPEQEYQEIFAIRRREDQLRVVEDRLSPAQLGARNRGSRGSSGSSEMGGISALLIRYSPHASRETAPAAGRPPDRPPESRDAFLSLLPHW